jgi:hypothetical protein
MQLSSKVIEPDAKTLAKIKEKVRELAQEEVLETRESALAASGPKSIEETAAAWTRLTRNAQPDEVQEFPVQVPEASNTPSKAILELHEFPTSVHVPSERRQTPSSSFRLYYTDASKDHRQASASRTIVEFFPTVEAVDARLHQLCQYGLRGLLSSQGFETESHHANRHGSVCKYRWVAERIATTGPASQTKETTHAGLHHTHPSKPSRAQEAPQPLDSLAPLMHPSSKNAKTPDKMTYQELQALCKKVKQKGDPACVGRESIMMVLKKRMP